MTWLYSPTNSLCPEGVRIWREPQNTSINKNWPSYNIYIYIIYIYTAITHHVSCQTNTYQRTHAHLFGIIKTIFCIILALMVRIHHKPPQLVFKLWSSKEHIVFMYCCLLVPICVIAPILLLWHGERLFESTGFRCGQRCKKYHNLFQIEMNSNRITTCFSPSDSDYDRRQGRLTSTQYPSAFAQ